MTLIVAQWIRSSFIRNQVTLVLIALAFLTRFPIPSNIEFCADRVRKACRYFPLIGWLIGLMSGLVFWIAHLWFPQSIAVLLAMLAGVLMTGCFHEDGMADTCDGLGGGWNLEQKLGIMKDSRVGSYGVIALWFTLSFKFLLLMSVSNIVMALIVAHPLSRAMSVLMMYLLPYVTDKKTSKVAGFTNKNHLFDLALAVFIGCLSMLLVPEKFLWLAVALLISTWSLREIFKRQIGGYTGDTLGATQQITELVIYAILLQGNVVAVSTGGV